MRALVTFGSERGGTRGLAEMVADDLVDEGLDVDLRLPGQVATLEGYDVVIVGGALYAMRWHKDARRLVRHHAAELRRRTVYFFSSGPLDDSAAAKDIPPVGQVRKLMELTGARGHKTFGGRLERDARGFIAGKMAKDHSGDWRDAGQVRRWAAEIAADLRETAGQP